MLPENTETETVAVRLQTLTKKLKEKYEPGAQTRHTSEEQRLQAICQECHKVSEQLVELLGTLKVPESSEHRCWKSSRQALKSVGSKKGIDSMSAKMAVLRSELVIQVLVHLR